MKSFELNIAEPTTFQKCFQRSYAIVIIIGIVVAAIVGSSSAAAT